VFYINNELNKRDNESKFDHHKRLIMGKLVDKSLSDEDYTDLSELAYGQRYSSDVARRMFYGSKNTIQLMEECRINEISDKTMISQAKEILGEQFLLKKQLQAETSKINKFKKDFVKSISIAEELAEIQAQNGFKVSVPKSCCEPIFNYGNYEMIVHITDFHIGYVIHECKGNKYNWEIANGRVDRLISEVYKYIGLYGIKKIYVINTGDTIEHLSMRKNQSQFCEFTQSEQVNHAIEIIFRFLTALCEKCEVEYDSVYGNHDRMNGDATANQDGDNADTIIKEQVKNYGKLAKMTRLTVVDRPHTDKEIIKEINGIMVKAKHGDKAIKDDKQQLKADISMDENFYGLLLKGHEHNFRCVSENRGRYIVSTGCLSGYNDYSTAFGCATVASQTIVILDQGKIELVKDVQLA
jgi:hypothetical protein